MPTLTDTESTTSNPNADAQSLNTSMSSNHQPMYRKRENKPGQKEKRVVKRSTTSPAPNNRKSGRDSKPAKNSSPKNENSKQKPSRSVSPASSTSSKTNKNDDNSKKKVKKRNRGKKSKQRKLSFWFCMSSNTDETTERKPQAPISKPKQQPSSIENADDKNDVIKDNSISENKAAVVEILTTKRPRSNATRRYSAPPVSDSITVVTKATVESDSTRPRSRTPTRGVRYRYDGTLERPYVYPGGLTFQSPDRSRNGDRYFTNSMCDSTFDESVSVFDTSRDQNGVTSETNNGGVFDISKQFYLRYDSDLSNTDSKTDDKNKNQLDSSMVLTSTENEQVTNKPSSPKEGQVVLRKKKLRREEALVENEEKRNSYYSTPLQNSGCIYMWHSCEDLNHCDCEERYHSKDGLNRICADVNETDNIVVGKNFEHEKDCHLYTSEQMISQTSNNEEIASTSRILNNELNNFQDIKQGELNVPCDTEKLHTNTQITNSQSSSITFHNNTISKYDQKHQLHSSLSAPIKPTHENNASPFKRNTARSSGMPGNKRFFIPPPPCYTPPREEMEAALPLMSSRCQRGSQTDLTEDVDQLDMRDRDLSLQRGHRLSVEITPSPSVINPNLYTNASNEPHQGKDDFSNVKQADVASKSVGANSEQRSSTKSNSSAKTSTPKTNRKSNTATSTIIADNSKSKSAICPKPLPRKKVSKNDSLTSSFSISETETVPSSSQLTQSPTPGTEALPVATQSIAEDNTSSLTSSVVRRDPEKRVPPVPKKRRSQMIEVDVLSAAQLGPTQSPLVSTSPAHHTQSLSTSVSATVHLSNGHTKHVVDGLKHQYVSSKVKVKPEIKFDNNMMLKNSDHIMKSPNSPVSPQNVTTSTSLRSTRDNSLCYTPKNSNSSEADSPPPLPRSHQRLAMVDNDGDDDDDGGCNADDEMSIHNEDGISPTSVQSLLRASSIFDRSLAVTRKRRQRLRDRKCRSQLLSSAELDDFHDVYERHLWKNRHCDDFIVSPDNDNPAVQCSNRINTNNAIHNKDKNGNPRFHILPSMQLVFNPLFYKNKRIWQHSFTDSGNDSSDMISPPPPIQEFQHLEDVFQDIDVNGRRDVKSGLVPTMMAEWELRLKQKHQLRKARSIEHLFMTSTNLNSSPNLETSV